MGRKIGKNALCPCGSGKKYKRCCLVDENAAPAPPPPTPPAEEMLPDPSLEETDRVAQDFNMHLTDSDELFDLMKLPAIDFEIPLFDPFMDDLGNPLELETSNPTALALRLHLGLEKHVTDEIRCRLAGEIEPRLKRTRKARTKKLAEAALLGLEDPGIGPSRIGVLRPFYYHYAVLHALEREMFLREEERNLDPELRKQAEKAREEWTEESLSKFARSLAPLGLGGVPYIELALQEAEVDERIAPLVEMLAHHPSMRTARLLEHLLWHCATPQLEELLFGALGKLSQYSVPNMLYRLKDPGLKWYFRWNGYRFLVRQGVLEAGDLLLDEILGSDYWEDAFPDQDFGKIPDLLAELGDRRAIGAVLDAISREEITPEGVNVIKRSFKQNGWWKEIETGLSNLRQGVIVLVPKGVEMMDLIREKFAKDRPPSMEAANFRMGIWNEEWNRAYHEDLEWLRPGDVGGPGRRERELMREFVEEFKIRARSHSDEVVPEELSREFSAQQGLWMVTPQEKLGGRVPLAVILEEKDKTAPPYARIHTRTYRRRKLQDLYAYARVLFEDGRKEDARRELTAILQIEPGHPFARRLLARAK